MSNVTLWGNYDQTATYSYDIQNLCGAYHSECPKTGYLKSIFVQMHASAPIRAITALYEYIDHSSLYGGSLLGQSEILTIPTSSSPGSWYEFNFSPRPPVTAGTNYYIGVIGESAAPNAIYVKNNNSPAATNSITVSPITLSALPSPLTGEFSNVTNWCMYATISPFSIYMPFLDDAGDLLIYYDTLVGPDKVQCHCSQWDMSNNELILTTWMDKSRVQTIRNHIVPGAVGELYQILGKPFYYDKTWEGNNTLYFVPNQSSQSDLKYKFGSTVMYVKSITVQPIQNNRTYLEVKFNGYISGGRL